jgi:hypothetical protein
MLAATQQRQRFKRHRLLAVKWQEPHARDCDADTSPRRHWQYQPQRLCQSSSSTGTFVMRTRVGVLMRGEQRPGGQQKRWHADRWSSSAPKRMINYKGFKVISWVMHLLHRLAARCHGSAAVAETRAIQVKFSKQKVLDSSVGSSSRIICGTSGSNCASDDGTRHHITGCNCSGKVVLKPHCKIKAIKTMHRW